MKIFIKTLAALVIMAFLFISCNRDDDNSGTNNPTATAGFAWREDSPTATEQKAPFANFQGKTLFALDANQSTVFEINLMKGSAPGTYTFDGDYINGTALVYTTKNFVATGGTITVTEKTATKISGKFEATGTGSVSKIYGTFTNIEIK